jgi:hypothetical protein
MHGLAALLGTVSTSVHWVAGDWRFFQSAATRQGLALEKVDGFEYVFCDFYTVASFTQGGHPRFQFARMVIDAYFLSEMKSLHRFLQTPTLDLGSMAIDRCNP